MMNNTQIRRINIFGGPGIGKCFVGGTPILMYDGTVKLVENIKEGDILMGWDSTPRLVNKTYSGIDYLYKIQDVEKPHCNLLPNDYIVNGNHILVLKTHPFAPFTKISVNNYIKLSFNTKQKLYGCYSAAIKWPHKDLSLDPYWLGVWLTSNTSTNFNLNIANLTVLQQIYKYSKSKQLKFHHYTKSSGKQILSYSTNTILKYLKQPNKNILKNRFIPKEYLINSIESRQKLWKGIISNAQIVHRLNKQYYKISTKYATLAQNILFLARSLGIPVFVEKSNNTCIIYADQDGSQLSNTAILHNINVVPTGPKQEYFGFSTTTDNMFLLGNFAIVHNSTLASHLFSLLKAQHTNVELVNEWIKILAYQKRKPTYWEQWYAFSKQLRKETKYLDNNVDIIITDSPLLLNVAYCLKYNMSYSLLLIQACQLFEQHYRSLNIFLERNINTYQNLGRYESLNEAIAMDNSIKDILIHHKIPFESFNSQAYTEIYNYIYSHIKHERSQNLSS